MERITHKDSDDKYYVVEERICLASEQINPIRDVIRLNEKRGYGKPIDKLGQLEDLEEELGVDLITLFKVLKNGFYYKDGKKIVHANPLVGQISLDWNDGLPLLAYGELIGKGEAPFVLTDGYGKTWALTEEELEND